MVLGNLGLLGQRLQVGQSKAHRIVHQPSYLKRPVLEVVLDKLLVLLCIRRISVQDHRWGDFIGAIRLAGAQPERQQTLPRPYYRAEDMLRGAGRVPRIPGSQRPDKDTQRNDSQADGDSQALIVIVLAEHYVAHVFAKPGHNDQCYVDNNESKEGYQPDEMQATGGLTATEEPGVPWELSLNGRRLCSSCEDQERSQHKYHSRVGKLLQRIKGVVRSRRR